GYHIGRDTARPFTVSFEVRGSKFPAGTFLSSENVAMQAERNAYSTLSSGYVENGNIIRRQKVAEIPAGDYEWTKVEATWQFPILCSGIVIRLEGKGGIVDIRNFQITNAKGGKHVGDVNFKKKAQMPPSVVLPEYLEEGGIRCDLSKQQEFVIPFGKHTVNYLGEHLREVCFAPLLAFKQKSAGTGTIFWNVKLNGNLMQRGRMQLLRETAPAVVPKGEIGIWIAESQFEDMNAVGKRNAYDFIKGLGINTVYLNFTEPYQFKEKFTSEDVRLESADIAREMGLDMRFYLHFFIRHHGVTHQPYNWVRNTYPEASETDFRGRKDHMANIVCESWFLDGPADKPGSISPYLDNLTRAITALIGRYQAKGLFWDYERAAVPTHFRKIQKAAADYQPWMAAPCCCQRCRQSFASQYNLEKVPTTEEILAEKNTLYDQWLDFQCRRSKRIWDHMRAAAKAGNPKAGLALYSGVPEERSREIYRVDWDLTGDSIDMAVTLHNWYAGDKAFDSYREALAKRAPRGMTIPVTASQTLSGYGNWEQRGAWRWIRQIKTNLLRRTFHLGADTYNICGIWGMDSQWNTSIRQANALIAAYQDFVRSAKRVDNPAVVPEIPSGAYMDTFSDGKRSVTFIYNPTDAEQKISVTLPGNGKKEVTITPFDVIPVELTK
ncbi:MAG: hypothetical protein J6S21_02940, partial [Victivallales bacterium]|nr:hypothetical protein [Victivallales bacterium]